MVKYVVVQCKKTNNPGAGKQSLSALPVLVMKGQWTAAHAVPKIVFPVLLHFLLSCQSIILGDCLTVLLTGIKLA